MGRCGLFVERVEAAAGSGTSSQRYRKGGIGRRMPPSRGGDCESRERGNVPGLGELKEVGGAEPEEYTETTNKLV